MSVGENAAKNVGRSAGTTVADIATREHTDLPFLVRWKVPRPWWTE
jgi:hypothetical protein